MGDLNDRSTDVSLHSASNNTQKIEMIYDSSIPGYRIPVDAAATIVNNESPTRYQLKADFDATGDSVTTSDTELYTYSGSGVIDLVAVNCLTSSNFGVVIIIDGTERLRITMSELGSDLGLTDSAFDVVAQTANKQFRWKPAQIGFTTSFTVKAFTTTGTLTLKHLVMFRERTS